MPKKLYLQVHATAEFGEAPAYAVCELTDTFVQQIKILREISAQYGLSECRVYADVAWSEEFDFSLRGEELVVASKHFWFTAYVKHTDYDVETETMTFDELNAALARSEAEVFHADDIDGLMAAIEEIEGAQVNL